MIPEEDYRQDSIINFDQADREMNSGEQDDQDDQVQHIIQDENHQEISMRRTDFIKSQTMKLQDQQRLAHSPLRLVRNQEIFASPQFGIDISQNFDDSNEQKIEFSYNIECTPYGSNKLVMNEMTVSDPEPEKLKWSLTMQRIVNSEEFQDESVQQQFDEQRAQEKYEKIVRFSDSSGSSPDMQSINQQSFNDSPISQRPQILKNINIIDKNVWINTPVPQKYILQCYIVRDNSGMAKFYPRYHLHLSENGQYLMTAKRLAIQKTSKYIMTSDKNDLSRQSSNYLGMIRSNFLGTEFMIYDTGKNPKSTSSFEDMRSQLAMINFQSNISQSQTPRQVRIVLPFIINDMPIKYRPLESREGLVLESQLPTKRNSTYFEFLNKLPRWDQGAQMFVLEFNQRVNKTSVKNVQIQQIDNDGHPINRIDSIVQFGLHDKLGFNLDFQYPFSPLQAFGVCVANFDYKLGCE